MPQSRLPDVNTAIIVYRREAITDLKGQRYDGCLGALHALNGMLPDVYRVKISTTDYNKMMKEGLFATCNFCTEESNFQVVKTTDVFLPFDQSIVSENIKEKIWICSHCHKENKRSLTKFTHKTFEKPYYLRVVPDPPTRKDGVMARNEFHRKFSSWFWTMLGEIEAQLAQFRDDNWKKPGSLYDIDEDFGDTGEEK